MAVSEFEWQGNFDNLEVQVHSESDLDIDDLDSAAEEEMPGSVTTLGRLGQKRDTGSASSIRRTSANSDRAKRTPRKNLQARQIRKKSGVSQQPQSDPEDDQNETEDSDPEDKLCSHLQVCLAECSRQRLRALQMSLRHYGNVDNRVSYKDMQISLQENQIKLSHRAVQMMTDLYQDTKGIDYARFYSCMDRAHLRTGESINDHLS
ncbi:echinoderm microtubule-associated protein-like 4 isoform X2 [Elysia marginata]|uniref:Echinoderm microtubule-associated protein-like 4 isoform X2 n=1 Tax=Elysia marginata TaxID=1093978 RepID=A0AAV4FY91_9GAST|nr:echinoderm microtubule-associated protein-like 4 isoform X2 [Elysia marginata]